MIDTNKLQKQPPVLKPKDLNGARVAILVIAEVETRHFSDGDKIRLVFEEFSGEENYRTYFPNITSLRNLVDALGADETKWPGNKVVLEVVKANDPRFVNKQVDALWVAEAATWPEHIEQYEKRAARKTATPATPQRRGDEHIPAARKSGKKKK